MKKQGNSNEMSAKPLEWPYKARESRDRSAEEAAAILRFIDDIIEATNDPTVLKPAARALKSAMTILRHMESQGAATRPE